MAAADEEKFTKASYGDTLNKVGAQTFLEVIIMQTYGENLTDEDDNSQLTLKVKNVLLSKYGSNTKVTKQFKFKRQIDQIYKGDPLKKYDIPHLHRIIELIGGPQGKEPEWEELKKILDQVKNKRNDLAHQDPTQMQTSNDACRLFQELKQLCTEIVQKSGSCYSKDQNYITGLVDKHEKDISWNEKSLTEHIRRNAADLATNMNTMNDTNKEFAKVTKELKEKVDDLQRKQKIDKVMNLFKDLIIGRGDINMIKLAIDESQDVNNLVDVDGVGAVHLTSEAGEMGLLHKLHDNGANFDKKTKKGLTTMHFASRGGSVEAITFLHDKNISVNSLDQHGNTPVHTACQYHREGHKAVINKLLELGGDKHHANLKEETPMDTAIKYAPREFTLWFKKLGQSGGPLVQSPEDQLHTGLWTPPATKKYAVRQMSILDEIDVQLGWIYNSSTKDFDPPSEGKIYNFSDIKRSPKFFFCTRDNEHSYMRQRNKEDKLWYEDYTNSSAKEIIYVKGSIETERKASEELSYENGQEIVKSLTFKKEMEILIFLNKEISIPFKGDLKKWLTFMVEEMEESAIFPDILKDGVINSILYHVKKRKETKDILCSLKEGCKFLKSMEQNNPVSITLSKEN